MYEWYYCPFCGQKLFMISDTGIIKGMQIKCKKCKRIINVEIN